MLLIHRAYATDRDSIRCLGLLPKRPSDKGSAAVACGNPAGVYLWTKHPISLWYDERSDDLWSVDAAGLELISDPLLKGAFYSPHPIDASRIKLLKPSIHYADRSID